MAYHDGIFTLYKVVNSFNVFLKINEILHQIKTVAKMIKTIIIVINMEIFFEKKSLFYTPALKQNVLFVKRAAQLKRFMHFP